jgi:hypothetical protein
MRVMALLLFLALLCGCDRKTPDAAPVELGVLELADNYRKDKSKWSGRRVTVRGLFAEVTSDERGRRFYLTHRAGAPGDRWVTCWLADDDKWKPPKGTFDSHPMTVQGKVEDDHGRAGLKPCTIVKEAPRPASTGEATSEASAEAAPTGPTFCGRATPLNRTEIICGDKEFTDLSPITSYSELQILDLARSGVTDVTPLSKLSNLQILSLMKTQVSDLRPLTKLVNLKTLFLDQTKVTDLKPLFGLRKLESLRLFGTKVSKAEVEALKRALPKLDVSGP